MPTLYLDCDGFFASCEESADPALHGRPVAVSTIDPDNRAAVLIAVNTAAKRRGLGKGERAEEARSRLPDIIIRLQRPELYVATHHAIALGDSIDRSGRYTGVKIAFEHIPAIAEFE